MSVVIGFSCCGVPAQIFKLLLVYCYVLNFFFFFFFFCILQGKANKIKYIKSYHFDLSSFINEGFMMVNRTKH